MYQTATKVNVLSPVIFNVKEADSFHLLEGSIIYSDRVRNKLFFRGLRQWYDTEWKLQELGRSKLFPKKRISATNLKKKENREDNLEVGLIHSKGVTGIITCETNSHSKGLTLLCRGKEKHSTDKELI